jgi:hypothetical protein
MTCDVSSGYGKTVFSISVYPSRAKNIKLDSRISVQISFALKDYAVDSDFNNYMNTLLHFGLAYYSKPIFEKILSYLKDLLFADGQKPKDYLELIQKSGFWNNCNQNNGCSVSYDKIYKPALYQLFSFVPE